MNDAGLSMMEQLRRSTPLRWTILWLVSAPTLVVLAGLVKEYFGIEARFATEGPEQFIKAMLVLVLISLPWFMAGCQLTMFFEKRKEFSFLRQTAEIVIFLALLTAAFFVTGIATMDL